jgi:hypothetical protein
MQAYEVMREVSKLLEQAKEQTIGSDSGDDKMCVDIQSVRDGLEKESKETCRK